MPPTAAHFIKGIIALIYPVLFLEFGGLIACLLASAMLAVSACPCV